MCARQRPRGPTARPAALPPGEKPAKPGRHFIRCMQPMPLSRLLSRVKFDYYLIALLATVAVAAVLPARGAAEPIAKYAVTVAVLSSVPVAPGMSVPMAV